MKEQQILFNISLLQQRKAQPRQIRPFFTATQQKLLCGCFLARAGFLCRELSTKHSSRVWSRGYQVAPGCPTARGAQMPSAAARVLSSGGRRGISSSLTACSAQTLARGRVLVTAAAKECVERGNKNGETWKASPAKRDKHTRTTHE